MGPQWGHKDNGATRTMGPQGQWGHRDRATMGPQGQWGHRDRATGTEQPQTTMDQEWTKGSKGGGRGVRAKREIKLFSEAGHTLLRVYEV